MKFHGYPSMYYSRHGISDLKFVTSRMKVIPEDLKIQISDQYEAFGPARGGEYRKSANIWLNSEALKYKYISNKKDDSRERVDIECNAPKEAAREFKAKVDANTPAKKKSFLDGLLDDVDEKYGNGCKN
jgi:hypothetical protein